MRDPKGYYHALGLRPPASAAAIRAAFRRKAKVLHPDVPRTGDTAEFMRVRAAYEALSDSERRAAYDRTGLPEEPAAARSEAPQPPRGFAPRAALWVGLVALGMTTLAGGVLVFGRAPPTPAPRKIASSSVGPRDPPRAIDPDPGPSTAADRPAGPPTNFVLPAAGDAVLWRYEAARQAYAPAGRLAALTPVELLRSVSDSAMSEIRTADGRVGFVEAARLAPGGAAAARQANCTYTAGPPPSSGEVLSRDRLGPMRLLVENQQDQPIVFQLRDARLVVAAEIFVGPRQKVTLEGAPTGWFIPQYASGELWSRGCGVFTAAMRGMRFREPIEIDAAARPGAALHVVIPPSAAFDISDETFSGR